MLICVFDIIIVEFIRIEFYIIDIFQYFYISDEFKT